MNSAHNQIQENNSSFFYIFTLVCENHEPVQLLMTSVNHINDIIKKKSCSLKAQEGRSVDVRGGINQSNV